MGRDYLRGVEFVQGILKDFWGGGRYFQGD